MDFKTKLSFKHIFLLIVSMLGFISIGFTHYVIVNSQITSKIKMSGWTLIDLIDESGIGFFGFTASLFAIIFLICAFLLFIWSIVGILNDLEIIKRKPNLFKCKFENISKYLSYGLMGSAFLTFFFAMIYSFVDKQGISLGFGLFFNLFVYTGGFWMFFFLKKYGKLNKILVQEIHDNDFFDVDYENLNKLEIDNEDVRENQDDIQEEKEENN